MMLTNCHAGNSMGDFDILDRCPEPYGTVLKSYTSTSLMFCCRKCHANPDCFSVVLDPSDQVCEENSGKTTRFSSGCSSTVKYVPLKQSSSRSVLHGACDSDADCTTAQSSCRSGICDCNLGFRYNPETVSCVKSCVTYGSTFTVHPGYSDNKLALPMTLLTVTDLDECINECLTAESFVCLSLNYLPNSSTQCRLKDIALSVQTQDSLIGQAGVALYLHRDCE